MDLNHVDVSAVRQNSRPFDPARLNIVISSRAAEADLIENVFVDHVDNTLLHVLMSDTAKSVSINHISTDDPQTLIEFAQRLSPLVTQRNCAGFTPLAWWLKSSASATPGVNKLGEALFKHFVSQPDFDFADHVNNAGENLISMLLKGDGAAYRERDFNLLVDADTSKTCCAEAVFHARILDSVRLAATRLDMTVKNKDSHSIAESYLLKSSKIHLGSLSVMVENGAFLSLNIKHGDKTIGVEDIINKKTDNNMRMQSQQQLAVIRQQCLINEVQVVAAAKPGLSARLRRNRIDI